MPRPIPKTPKPQPKPETPKPEEPAPPESIDWKDIADAGLNKDQADEAKLWDLFTDMAEYKENKPLMIYFFYPHADADG